MSKIKVGDVVKVTTSYLSLFGLELGLKGEVLKTDSKDVLARFGDSEAWLSPTQFEIVEERNAQ